ncbi:hypothetical protein EFQ08_08445, partial [Limosilactobacillus fermentum]|nr:hypothetical protein [Limosilactobacillus fermentum]
FANVFASIIKIKDPTHLIRRNIIQFSKVYHQQLIKSLTSFLIISSNHFDVKNFFKDLCDRFGYPLHLQLL